MIVSDRFKSYSLFTADELNESILRDLENMSDEERAVFYEILQDPHFESDLNAMELDREMVSVTQWIEDDYYMGTLGKTIYKPWKDDLVELFESSQYDTAVIVGGLGCHAITTKVMTSEGLIEAGNLTKSHKYLSHDNGQMRFVRGTHAFVKGKDMLYRVTHQDGSFDVTAHHKVMCSDGQYRRVDQLNPLTDSIVSVDQSALEHDVSCAQVVMRILSNFLDHYFSDSYLCGELLLLSQEVFQVPFPSHIAIQPGFSVCRTSNGLLELFCPDIYTGSDDHQVGLDFFDLNPAYADISQRMYAFFQRLGQSHSRSCLSRIAQALAAFARQSSHTLRDHSCHLFSLRLSSLADHFSERNSQWSDVSDRQVLQSLSKNAVHLIARVFSLFQNQSRVLENKADQVDKYKISPIQRLSQLLKQCRRSLFHRTPFSLSSLSRLDLVSQNPLQSSIGVSLVQSIEKIKTDWYWDLQVPVTNNYVAGGAVHHNCVAGETLVQLADGSIEPIKELAGKAFDVNPWRGSQTALGVFNGVKPVYEMKVANGFTLKATAEHKWMTQDGWVRTDQINPAYHRIRSPRFITSTPCRFDVTVAEAEWAGIFCSAGKLHSTEVEGVKRYIFIKSDPERMKIFTDLCAQLEIKFEQPSITYVSMDAKDLTALFEKLGITDPVKYRTIPKSILQSSNEVLAGFIRGALISANYSGLHDYISCSVTLTSQLEGFLQYMTLALKRFGIRSRIVPSDRRSKTFNLAISGKSNINLFAEHISLLKKDTKNLFEIMVTVIKSKVEKSHSDFLPVNYGDALAWTKKHKVSIGATKYAKWCGRDSSDLKVSHVDILNFCKQWPHMHAHAYELFYDSDTIWEEIKSVNKTDNVIPVFDLIVPDDNSYLAYGMASHNSGKSTFSHLAVLRMIYEASCLKNPAVSYGLSPNSVIGFCSLAKSKETARRVVFEQLAQKIQESPYFKYDFPPVKDLKAEILFPKGLAIIAGSSTDTSIIGMNIFGGIIDEVNFWGRVKKSSLSFNKSWGSESKSGRLFDSVRRRMKSRYVKKGKLPGIIMLVSSKTTLDSFTDQFVRKEQAMGTRSTFVRDRSILEMKKGSFNDRTFRVLIGTIDYASKILLDGEDVSNYKDAIVIDIPEDFRSDFEANLEESLRDIAGVSTIAISNFIAKVEKVNEMIDKDRFHPFQCPLLDDPNTWDSRKSYKMNWYALCDRKANGEWIPKLNPEAPRHVHLDPAFTGDAYGLCIAHVGGMVPVQESGDIIEYQPMIVVDFILAIQGSKEEEVICRNVRELCYEFSNHGFHLAEFSMDTYQSRETCQALEQNGYKAGIYSVDTGISSRGENVINTAIGRIPKAKQAYWYLRSAIYEGRVKCYDYPILYRELRRLEDGPEKVDHPEGEGKDLADALCGVVWTLFRSRYSGEFLAPSKGITLNPRAESESMADYQESITDRYSNTVDNLLDQALAMQGKGVQEIAGTKVYQKTKPKTVSPKYQKVNMDNTIDDLTYNPDDFVQRG